MPNDTELTPETPNVVPVPVLNDVYVESSVHAGYKVCRECATWVGTPHEGKCKLGWLEWAARELRADRAALAEARRAVRDVIEEKARGGWCEECKQPVDEGFGPQEAHAMWCFVGRLLAALAAPGTPAK